MTLPNTLMATAAIAALTLLAACGQGPTEAPAAVEEVVDTTDSATETAEDASAVVDAMALHDGFVTLDMHLDTPLLLTRPGFDIMARNSVEADFSQVDVPRMQEGRLDGGFWVIYTAQGPLTAEAYESAKTSALATAEAIQAMVADNPDVFALATEPEDAAAVAAEGKIIVYQSIENSYPIGEDLSLMQTFYDYGVRMIGPVHFSNNQFADSSTDSELLWDGLSPLGEELVREANRLGMIVDASHAHDLALDDMLDVSGAPIILSHSGPKGVYDHPRNVDDARLLRVVEAGGVIGVNAFGGYLTELEVSEERNQARRALFASLQGRSFGDLSAEELAAFNVRRREIDEEFPPAMADFEDYIEHFLYLLELVGPDHLAVGADWDGGGGVTGMNDVSAIPRITERLLAEGYTEEDLDKIWSGNAIRLLADVKAYAESLAEE